MARSFKKTFAKHRTTTKIRQLIVSESHILPPNTDVLGIPVTAPEISLSFNLLFYFSLSGGKPLSQNATIEKDGQVNIVLHQWDDPNGIITTLPVEIDMNAGNDFTKKKVKVSILYWTSVIGETRRFEVSVWYEDKNG